MERQTSQHQAQTTAATAASNGPSDKEVLYNMLNREIQNLVSGVPMLGMFGGLISNYVIKLIDPYVNAFMEQGGKSLNTEQLGAFASQEVEDKIKLFKEKFNKERNGNFTNE